MRYLPALGAFMVMGSLALASEDIADQYPQSALYSKPVEVIPHVWSAIGATAPPTYDNHGHNNNLSFIVTGDGVVVINSYWHEQGVPILAHEDVAAEIEEKGYDTLDRHQRLLK